MAIKVTKDGTVTTVIDDNGKLTNSPVLALSPSSTASVIVKEQNPQGNIAGFISGGSTTDAPSMPKIDNIEKFLFSNVNASATEIGNLSATKTNHAGNSSLTHGFATGGPGAPAASMSFIDKFPFAQTSGTASDVGDMSPSSAFDASTNDAQGDGTAFVSGGISPSAPLTTTVTTIRSYPHSISSGTSSSVGNLTESIRSATSCSSVTHGYRLQGRGPTLAFGPTNPVNTVDKFPFAITSGSATDIGSHAEKRCDATGLSSETHGFTMMGRFFFSPIPYGSQNNSSNNKKFPFAIESGFVSGSTESWSSWTTAAGYTAPPSSPAFRYDATGVSSEYYGFIAGGRQTTSPSGGNAFNDIRSFSFTNDASGNPVSELTTNNHSGAGHQF